MRGFDAMVELARGTFIAVGCAIGGAGMDHPPGRTKLRRARVILDTLGVRASHRRRRDVLAPEARLGCEWSNALS